MEIKRLGGQKQSKIRENIAILIKKYISFEIKIIDLSNENKHFLLNS